MEHPCRKAWVVSPYRVMSKRVDGSQSKPKPDEELLYFSLPGLLKDNQTLVVNPARRTAMLFWNDAEGGIHIATQQQFSPNGMRVLLPLLQAYPKYCPYDVLLASLFPLSREEGQGLLHASWEPSIRPLRRAIGSILPGLYACGMNVNSLRGLGYQLVPLSLG